MIVFLLSFPFASLFLLWFFCFSFTVCFRLFISFFSCTILMRNIFYRIAFLTRHIRMIKSALIILLQVLSQGFLRAGSFGKLGYNIFEILWEKITRKHPNNFSKYTYHTIQFNNKGITKSLNIFTTKEMLFSFATL